MQPDYAQAWAYVAALTQQSPDTAIIDVRMIHDRDNGVPAVPRRGTLPSLWQEICNWNSIGYGVFVNVSDMDGQGHLLSNVTWMRCQAVDLDNIDAAQQLAACAAWHPAPAFWVCSSPHKYHVYWHTPYHNHAERFGPIQRKLAAQFGGDRRIVDPSRVLRLPGTLHTKGEPHLVTCGALAGHGVPHTLDTFEHALAHVDASAVIGARHTLGSPDLSAPSLQWLDYAMAEINPNSLDRGEWISLMAAYKQAGWMHATEDELQTRFMAWCARYDGDNPAENLKNWRSIRDSEVGWLAVLRKAPSAFARFRFGDKAAKAAAAHAAAVEPSTPDTPPSPTPTPIIQPPDTYDELLSVDQCKQYFAGCIYVATLNEILGPKNVFYSQSAFNSQYGGKKFVIDQQGKTVDMAWEAAVRSTLWTIPKVHHTRFLPSEPNGKFIEDELGRAGVNTYMPARIARREGNVQPFLDHMAQLIPLQSDRDILLSYMAHVVKYPGYKIPWAPVIQSTEGAGKGVLKRCMSAAIGHMYCHFPNAHEMSNSGSKFNGWMRNKLFILCDEIKVDERRDMIEILKPMISEDRIEVQSKGVDQVIEDNCSNWMFFTNYKDAVPVSANGRRFAIFYSPLQSVGDLLRIGMDQTYFDNLFAWLNGGGNEIVTDWLMRYPIERGAIPMRAPITSSTDEAIRATRSPLEQMVIDAVDEGAAGFRHGYVSVPAVSVRAKSVGMRTPSSRTVQTVLEALGYSCLGRAPISTTTEQHPIVYAVRPDLPLAGYSIAQGVMVPASPVF